VRDSCGGDRLLEREVLALLESEAGDESRLQDAVAVTARELLGIGEGGLAGREIGAWRILERIAFGGMGAVYLVERATEEFEQRAALKLVNPALLSAEARTRFHSERQILARLNHPQIARLLDGGSTTDGLPYLVMEFIDGRSVDVHCNEAGLDTSQRLELFLKICDAVEYAHRNLVVHRDLKPSNILVDDDGLPKLLDFGIAKLLGNEQVPGPLGVTRESQPLTPSHASPEQITGGTITTATDVYALGVLLYQLLTGRSPYEADATRADELARAICETDPERPSAAVTRGVSARLAAEEARGNETLTPERLKRELTGDLDSIVLKAMRKEPQARYGSVEQLAQDVRAYLDGRPVAARQPTRRYYLRKFMLRNRARLGLGGFAATLIAVLVSYHTFQLSRERTIAQQERDTARRVTSFMLDVFEKADPYEQPDAGITAREVVDRAVVRIEDELGDEPRVQATLLVAMGGVYRSLGLWPQSIRLLERAVELEERHFGQDHLEYAVALAGLSLSQEQVGDYADSEQLLRRALVIFARLNGPSHPDTIRYRISLGHRLRNLLRYDEALATYDVALQAIAGLPGSPTVETLLADVHMGIGRTRLDRYETALAERHLRESLAHRRQRSGEPDFRREITLSLLAEALRRLGRFSESESIHRELLTSHRAFLGEQHPVALADFNNLSLVLRQQGRFRDAEQALRQSLAMDGSSTVLAPHSEAVHRSNLGTTLYEAGRLLEAESELQRALAMKLELMGENHPSTALTRSVLGSLQLDLGDIEAAEDSLERAAQVFRQTVGQRDYRYASTAVELGRLRLAQGRRDESRILIEAARESLERNPAITDLQRAKVLVRVGETLLIQPDLAAARSAFRSALELLEPVVSATHPLLARTRSGLGAALSGLGDLAAAEPLLQSARDVLQATRPADDRFLREAATRFEEHRARSSRSEL